MWEAFTIASPFCQIMWKVPNLGKYIRAMAPWSNHAKAESRWLSLPVACIRSERRGQDGGRRQGQSWPMVWGRKRVRVKWSFGSSVNTVINKINRRVKNGIKNCFLSRYKEVQMKKNHRRKHGVFLVKKGDYLCLQLPCLLPVSRSVSPLTVISLFFLSVSCY